MKVRGVGRGEWGVIECMFLLLLLLLFLHVLNLPLGMGVGRSNSAFSNLGHRHTLKELIDRFHSFFSSSSLQKIKKKSHCATVVLKQQLFFLFFLSFYGQNFVYQSTCTGAGLNGGMGMSNAPKAEFIPHI